MRTVLFFAAFFLVLIGKGQDSLQVPRHSLFYGLTENDSVVVYQCRVIDPEKEPKIASDYVPPVKVMYTITDKLVIRKSERGYLARVYRTHMRDLPNRKFSGLKIRERPYWMFEFVRRAVLSEEAMKLILSVEANGREAIEFDYAITKHTRNQVIFKRGKNFKQLLPHTNTRLAELVK